MSLDNNYYTQITANFILNIHFRLVKLKDNLLVLYNKLYFCMKLIMPNKYRRPNRMYDELNPDTETLNCWHTMQFILSLIGADNECFFCI